jgi:uncharacterized membrane protein
MKKTLITLLFIVFTATVSATTVSSQNITIDLEDSTVVNEIHVSELTSTNFTYSSSHPIRDLQVAIDGERTNCALSEAAVGGEISCEVDQTQDFTVQMNYTTNGLVSDVGGSSILTYTESVVIPTENLYLKVFLPQGTGIVDQQNSSRPVISPESGMTGSDGRKIFVEWEEEPELGETIEYHVIYRGLSERDQTQTIIALAVGILVLGLAGFLGIRYFVRQEVEDLYEDLDEDEVEIMEIIVENDGSILQKDLVEESGYSKAKISGVVSSLVDKEILEKEKEGRSNKLSISRKLRF